MGDNLRDLASAINDFRRARNQAALQEILARLTGETTQLLSFDEVRQKLRLEGSAARGVKDIPLDAIVGSVGRYTDFTRDFLPRQDTDADRWARVKVATTGLVGLPPIEVYQIGEVYFVQDGNHRVSVARQLGATHIQAYVTEVRSRVPLTPAIQPDELILKAEYVGFLEQTHLDELRPGCNLSVTVPGQYKILAEHIEVHRYYLGLEQQRFIPYEEAVASWYDNVYMPVVEIIQAQGILQSFPNRTETDLYLWLAEHRAALERDLGWQIRPEAAASDLVSQFSPRAENLVARLSGKLLESTPLSLLEAGPPAGQWRREKETARRQDRLFQEILVPVNGEGRGWYALDMAIQVAQREGAQLRGLHVTPNAEGVQSEAALAVQQEFRERCRQAGIPGDLVITSGEVSRQICSRSRWTDLVITTLAYPPAPQPLARLSSGFRDLIQRCPRPLMAVPQTHSPLSRGLLAYDGSSKADEALYVATYLAGQWGSSLVVVTIMDGNRVRPDTIQKARDYLQEHGVQAAYIVQGGPPADTILQLSEEHACDYLVMGGYGVNPVLEVVLGSVVDQVLRESRKPMLICR